MMEKAVEFSREREREREREGPLMEKAQRSIVLSFSPGVNEIAILL